MPPPPVEAIDDQIIPEDKRVCQWHLYTLIAPHVDAINAATQDPVALPRRRHVTRSDQPSLRT